MVVVLFYFLVWNEIRGAFTTYLMIPQVELAAAHCTNPVGYEVASDTAITIFHGDTHYRFNAPAGFYFLFAMIFIVMLNGKNKYYRLIIGYHLVFAMLSLLTFYPGLCYMPVFLHLSAIGNSYFTPFFTFFVLILLISPRLNKKTDARYSGF